MTERKSSGRTDWIRDRWKTAVKSVTKVRLRNNEEIPRRYEHNFIGITIRADCQANCEACEKYVDKSNCSTNFVECQKCKVTAHVECQDLVQADCLSEIQKFLADNSQGSLDLPNNENSLSINSITWRKSSLPVQSIASIDPIYLALKKGNKMASMRRVSLVESSKQKHVATSSKIHQDRSSTDLDSSTGNSLPGRTGSSQQLAKKTFNAVHSQHNQPRNSDSVDSQSTGLNHISPGFLFQSAGSAPSLVNEKFVATKGSDNSTTNSRKTASQKLFAKKAPRLDTKMKSLSLDCSDATIKKKVGAPGVLTPNRHAVRVPPCKYNSIESDDTGNSSTCESPCPTSACGSSLTLPSNAYAVTHDYCAKFPEEIELRVGERVIVTDNGDQDWWQGHNVTGRLGIFPSTCVAHIHCNEKVMQVVQNVCLWVGNKNTRLYRDQSNSPEDRFKRREAEQYLLQMRSWWTPFPFCQFVLENASTDDFVRYSIVGVLKEVVIRDWQTTDSGQIQFYWQYLLNYVCANSKKLSTYLTNEILSALAMIVKRGTFDGKTGETAKIYDTVTNLIFSGDVEMASLACQILLNMCLEYCTTWKSSVGLTWDFHIRAKRNFEQTDLKKIFGLSLQVLHGLIGEENFEKVDQRMIQINRFLNLAVCILNWNFSSKYLPKRLTYAVEFSPAATLHPPETWRDVFDNLDVLQFFFTLHEKVRLLNDSVSNTSMQCLTQLASLCSSIFRDTSVRDKYLTFFVSNCLKLFQSAITRNEVANFAEMIRKLLNNRPLQSPQASNSESIAHFYQFLTRITCEFCQKAALENWENSEDRVYQEAHMKILDSWAVLLRAESRIEVDESRSKIMTEYAACVFDCYFRCHLSVPFGCRPQQPLSHTEHQNDEDLDDKELFIDVLSSIGVFGRHSVQRTVDLLKNAFAHLLMQYQSSVEKLASDKNICGNYLMEQIQVIQEDLHWLLLITSHFLTAAEAECIFYVPIEIHVFSSALSSQKKISLLASQEYLSGCMTSPGFTPEPECVDPVVELIGHIVRWSMLENNLMIHGHHITLSPQVAESTCWCLRRVMSAYCENDERYASPSTNCVLKETFQSGTLLSSMITELILNKFFAVLTHWSSEVRLNKEASLMLITFLETDNKAAEVTKNENALHKIKDVCFDRLCPSARKDLLKSIVKICLSSEENVHSRQILDSLILSPLQSRYANLLEHVEKFGTSISFESPTSSDLLSVLDCFSGIIQGVGSIGAKSLFNYILPVLNSSLVLLSVYKNEQSVIDSVLQLFADVTYKLTSYISNQNEAEVFYRCVLAMLQCYATNNAVKYVGPAYNFEEDKISDLLIFLQILSNLLSKDVFISLGGGCAPNAQIQIGLGAESSDTRLNVAVVIITGLETVIPLMTDDFLKYPPICSKFCKLITNLCQMYPANVCRFPAKLRHDLLQSIKSTLTFEHGTDAVRYSLDFLNALATFVLQHGNMLNAEEIKSDLIYFLKLVFETCLKAGCQIDLLHDAPTCLFSLICLNEEAYELYVRELINSHDEPQAKAILLQAFEKLLRPSNEPPLSLKQNQYRMEKIKFRDRFESFLDNVQGVLSV